MTKISLYPIVLISLILFFTGCSQTSSSKQEQINITTKPQEPLSIQIIYDPWPKEEIHWLTNTEDPLFSSPEATKGGIFRTALLSFPITFRTVGPDSNGSFRSAILNNQLSLINIHPNTQRIIPEMADYWAFSKDKKTMYFKLDPSAKWSDGKPVTAWDYKYTLEFMRSKHIIAPWYNDYYTQEIERVLVFDDYTIGVQSTKAVPDLYLQLNICPIPEHFFHPLDADFIYKTNWAIVPNTGPYQISKFKKGKFIRFERKKDWWAQNKQYFKQRFNADVVIFTVIRDANLQWEYFKKGKLDVFNLNQPKYWHQKSDIQIFKNGLVHKIWFFNDLPRPSMGMWLNQDKEIFNDQRLRMAFAHGMNIELVINKVLRGDYYRLAQAFQGYGPYTDEAIKPRNYNLKKVSQLMKEAGWSRGKDGIWCKNGRRFSVQVTYGYDDHMPILAVLKQEALKAGIELKLERLDLSAMFKKFLEKKHDVAWMGWSTGIRPSYWQGWHSDNAHKTQTNNITNTDDPELDLLINQYRGSLDSENRIILSKKIQQKIHNICAFIPTFIAPYVRDAYWQWMKLPELHATRMSDDLFDPFSTSTGGLFWIDSAAQKQAVSQIKKNNKLQPVTIVDTKYKL